MFNQKGPSGRETAIPYDPAGFWDRIFDRRCSMTFVPVMWTIWSAFVVFTAALYIYRSSLTKNEEDQIFLDDSFSHEKAEQAVITAKVNKVEPLVRIARWLVVGMTVVVIAYYVRDVVLQLHLIQ